MKKRLLIALLLSAFGAGAQTSKPIPRPKLIVGIVCDQMRWDYLYRYWDRYGETGFKRLLNQGFSCEQTMIDYLPTYTGPGHACIWTGSVPAIHGIAGNDWIESRTGKAMYCVSDARVNGVGGSQKGGRMSPRNMLSSTLGDELKLATNGRSRTYAISLKDRASILPGGHMADGVYWYDDSTGNFITSTFYRNALPDWLNHFNSRKMPDSLLQNGWQLLQPEGSYRHSTADNTPYEGKFPRETAPVFPHNAMKSGDYGTLRAMPAGNTLTLELAKTLLLAENLGSGTDPDLLAINLASTDYAGHLFGPNALEMEDLYLRLDLEIGRFLSFLDRRYGKNNVLLFLTADHGGAHNPQFLKDRRVPAGMFTEAGMAAEIRSYTDSSFGVNEPGTRKEELRSLIRFFDNYYIYLDDSLIVQRGYDKEAIIGRLRRNLLNRPGIANVVRLEDRSVANLPEPLRTRVLNGYHTRRSGDLLVIPEPGWFAGYAPTGTTHGTWNPYDAHIPLIWHGWHIPQGETTVPYHMTDIAATVCALLKIQMPNGCIGKPVQFPVNGKGVSGK